MSENPEPSQIPETIPTLEKDGFEVVVLPLHRPNPMLRGVLQDFLRPSNIIKDSRKFLLHDPERAEIWRGTIDDPATKKQQDTFFAEKGYMQFETQFPRHVVAARTKPVEISQSET